jgi:gamma-glutamyl-gamma-aminobutyrate hydrolase PuuD
MKHSQKSPAVQIAVSKGSANYFTWLNKLHPGVEITDFSNRDPADFVRSIRVYSGLLLTGGGDIHPGFYGNTDIGGHCINMDAERDKREWKMIETAVKYDLPIMAICRGMQMINVVWGGTLFTDIPSFLSNSIIHKDHEDVYHPVSVIPGSLIHSITQCTSEIVNSSHHQAVDRLAPGMAVTSCSSDGVIEAIEHINSRLAFCVGVQWHPERMDILNPMSGKLGRAFIDAAGKRVTGDG